ncbi:putative ribonuclease H-like domain-containing protein [Tanacetum coccineum]
MRYLSLVDLLNLVVDETVYKEWEDRMERAATTASSLDAKQDNDTQTRFETTSKQSNDPPLSRGYTLGSGEDKQFWQTASASTPENREMEITTTIDGKVKVVFEASIKRHLKLEDSDGISTLTNAEIFEQLALMFSSNIATAIICLATNSCFNFSKLTFESMVKILDTKTKFLMYLRFIQIFLNKHKRLLLPHKRAYIAPTLTYKLFSNMRRAKDIHWVNHSIIQTMLVQGQNVQCEGSTIPVESHHTPTSAPSTSQPPTSSPSMQTTYVTEEATPMPHDLPLLRVYSLRSDEGSMTLNELTVLYTQLSTTVASLEEDLKQTKKRTNIVVSDDEENEEDSSKQGQSLIEDMDLDAGISLVPPHVADQGRRRTVSTASGLVSTAGMAQEVEINIPSPVATKDKGKAVMQEYEPPKKIKKRVQIQMSIDEELAQKLHEEEQARFNAE